MKQVISASRRTDMPAWYSDRLSAFIRKGFAEVHNPYSGKSSIVDLSPDCVHTMVFWSKNFRNFLCNKTIFEDYHVYFLFTINDMPAMERMVPSLDERISQIRELADEYGPDRIAWRFDPVIFDTGGALSTIDSFYHIGREIAKTGVKRTIFSFLDMYGKVKKRNERLGLNLYDPADDVKVQYAQQLAGAADGLGLSLESCSESIGTVDGIKPSACIDGNLLSQLSGEPASTAKDPGQRPDCTCTVSRDIGSYRNMPCPGGCLYCYANPLINNELTVRNR